jgi:hypothetical protein
MPAQRRGGHWTPDEDRRLLELAKAGKSLVFISANLKRPASGVRLRLTYMERRALEVPVEEIMPIPRRGHPWTAEDDQRLRSMVEANISIHLIAAKLNRSTEGIRSRTRTLKISVNWARVGLKVKK